ncbi:MAG: hypothetical protein LBG15_05405 [Dysgonamonadaceae bacterium]|nr:hypothetical protein [Dysgonamonadaceae bacterium]
MKQKMIFLALTLWMLSATSVNAQVRIGGTTDPNESAILDLNATNTADNGTLGLALPRVQLTSTDDVATITTPATGLTVYNTASNGSGATAVVPGVYIYNGSSWTRSSASIAPVIITQPKAFSWSRLKETNGDPNGPETATIADLSVTAVGPGTLTYQWYQKSVNRNAPDTKLTDNGATTATYTPVVTSWGMKSYYCVVKNGIDSVVSTIADVAIGCGAKTNRGNWLRFMCHNLGADTSLDPFTYLSNGNDVDNDIKGYLFQWGRIADDHQLRSSATVEGPYNSSININVLPEDVDMYSKFITNTDMATLYDWRTPQYDMAWRNYNGTTPQPCPSGWRIPTSDEWGSIYREGSSYGVPAAATANTWIWTTRGYHLKPDGATVTLSLPAAGYRLLSGTISLVGSCGYYWSSTSASSYAFGIHLASNRVFPMMSSRRACGYSVRCVSETYD